MNNANDAFPGFIRVPIYFGCQQRARPEAKSFGDDVDDDDDDDDRRERVEKRLIRKVIRGNIERIPVVRHKQSNDPGIF